MEERHAAKAVAHTHAEWPSARMDAGDVNVLSTSPSRIPHRGVAISRQSAMTQAKPRRTGVDKNRTEGTKHEIKGAVKEGVGKVTGNKGKQVAGNVEKNAGKVQKEVGKAADRQRDEEKKRRS